MMNVDFDTVLSIVGFYFTLIGLLGSLFFIHLGSWYKDISTTAQKWMRYKHTSDLERQIECYLEAFDEKSPLAAIGFALLTLLMLVLGGFALWLRFLLPSEGSLANFLYIPLLLFFAMYLFGSLAYLVLGYSKVRQLFAEIDEHL